MSVSLQIAELIVLQGLPASGKSTYRKQLVASDPTRYVYSNKDELRRQQPQAKEKAIHRLQNEIIRGGLATGKSVVVDNTNFNPRTLEGLRGLAREAGLAYDITLKTFDTPWQVCVERDALRGEGTRVGRGVILSMALKFGLFYEPRLRAIICDIDGTLADIAHRRHHLDETPPNWAAFNATMHLDSPAEAVIEQYKILAATGKFLMICCSGREERFRRVTETWLAAQGIEPFVLLMRPYGDSRQDAIVKQEIYRQQIAPYFDVAWVYDDRDQVVKMWRDEGLTCMQVAPGNF